ncbi:replication protein A 70 kDa DNA-binding subunit-like [Liolophura sinensis]|uniref:replication protein A 70 kDa DNA-binding subunit-like n=1 Tax=Liolophura sinensis TaxID=3198878 RepID=UPI00315956A1
MMLFCLLQRVINGEQVEKPVLQLLSSKKITGSGNADRYRLLLSDGKHSYSHAMLATQMNSMVESGEMDSLAVLRIDKYMANVIQPDRRVMILLGITVLARGQEVGQRIGNPQQYRPGEQSSNPAPVQQQAPVQNGHATNKFTGGMNNNNNNTSKHGPPAPYGKKVMDTPGTPGGGGRIHSIISLTPYQNRWRIRARVTNKSSIRTWSNSRGEGKLFSVNLLDESGEIRATGFNDAVDKFYDFLEVNKVYYISKGTLKTANKQYTSINNDYEMTFNSDTMIELCDESVDLPTMTFDFVEINKLDSHQPGALIDVIGVVRSAGDVGTVVGRQSNREISKRELQLVDQSGMGVNLTLWGNEAESFEMKGSQVMAVKGCRLSDYGGRSLSCLASSQMIVNPDIREAQMLRGWYDKVGQNMDFTGYRNEGGMGAGAGSSTNWKYFSQVKTENLGHGDKADYFTAKGTVLFLRKENCMYQACPSENCNKKVVDQGNGLYRCEKCQKEFPNHKWRMILSANLSDFSDNQWVTCFQESAEMLLGAGADQLGDMRESNEVAFDQVFQQALFKTYIFKLRAKVETYNDESRLKTVCVNAAPIDWVEHGKRLVEEINKMSSL